ncbi:LysR substrate-binding domain-containing protein [Agilicoccus flavus]|uniref:LysR substrate-binding domain-containing protein n=1 Tax=Agilicoccus flavus TaxID=2775968 RepID=UPI001CF6C0D4|nr:LysR substrate-binding domain-containing protein [Agilicoccus flavus]
MELRQVRYFVAVAEECHFGRAAKRLHMAQPPLSQQIRRLEDELGVVLLERTTRRVALTPAGERYLERCRRILADVEAAGQEAARVSAGEVGRVVVGVVGSATYAVLPSLARRLRADLPDIEVEFTSEMLTPDQVVALHEGSLDVVLMRTPTPVGDLLVRVLRREPLVVAVPTGHALAERESLRLEDLRDEPFVTYPSGYRSVLHDVVAGACQRVGFRPRQAAQVAQTSTLLVFVAAGIGVAVLPESGRRLRLEGVTFVPLQDGPSVELAVGWRPGSSAAVQRVVDLTTDLLTAPDPVSADSRAARDEPPQVSGP